MPVEREPGFTTAQVQQLTGLTLRRLNYRDHTGLLKPSGASAAGPGSRRLYTFTDLVQLKTISYLLEAGITLQKVRKALAYLAQQMPDIKKPLAELQLVASRDGTFLLVESQKRFLELVKTPGRLVFFVPMGVLAQETRQTLQKLQTTQALVSARIQVDPAIMGSLPVIRGTRIPCPRS